MPRPSKPPRLRKFSNRDNWYVQDGRKSISTGTPIAEDAACFLAEYVALKSRPSQPTFAQLLDFRAEDMLARRTFRSARPQDIHRNLREHFGRLKPAQISSPIINQFMAKRSNAPGMLREELIEFNATLNLALREGLIEKAVRAKLPAKKPPRDNYISKEQADQLLAAATAFHLQLFIMIATHTGMRKGAILDLTWDRVDFERTRLNFNNPEKTFPKFNAAA